MIVQTLSPTADGSIKQISYPSGAAHYNTKVGMDAGYWQTDTYVMQNPTRSGIITNVRVQISSQARPNQEGYQKCKTAIYKSGNAIVYGSEMSPPSSVWTTYYTDYPLNPWTGVGWTWDHIDSLEAGPALKAYNEQHSYAEAYAPATALVVTSVVVGGGAQIIGLSAW